MVPRLARPAPSLADDTIRLEPLDESHVAGLQALVEDPDVVRFTHVPTRHGDGFAARWVDRYTAGWQEGSRAGFAIVDSAGTFLGMTALVTIDWDARQAEVGYIVAPEARGRGIAQRTLALVSAWVFEVLGLKRLEARIEPGNERSVRVAERAGFRRDGVLRSVHFKEGMRCDLAVYSLLPGDPRPSYA
jgi:RimJ/RimL family protein N-acetyltransferase